MTDKKRAEDPAFELEERELEVLRAILREHILTGEPIGSRTVSRDARLSLSPASIRSVMAALEARGFLLQPHTSAGRVPTSRAYRLYVDRMVQPRLTPAEAEEIDRTVLHGRGELAELLAEASRLLSRCSNQVGVVLAPEFRRIVVDRLEFVRLDDRRVAAIVIARSGVINNRVLDVDESLAQSDLDRVGRYLSEEFGGRTLPQMLALVARRLSEERAAYDRLLARTLDLGRRALEAELGDAAGVFVEGASNLFDFPEFSDLEILKRLMRTLEDKRTLLELLTRMLEAEGVQVVIGEESASAELARCSVVTSTYGSGDRVMGTVGIVGPTRMEYARAIALVDHLAKVLSRLFSSPGN